MINLLGKAKIANLKVSSNSLDYKFCKLNEQKDIIISVTNMNLENSLDINF